MIMCVCFLSEPFLLSNKKFAYVNVLGGAVFPIKTWRVFYSKIMVLHPKPKVVRKVLRLNFRHVKVARLQSLFRDIFARVRLIWQKSSNRSSSISVWLVFMHFSRRIAKKCKFMAQATLTNPSARIPLILMVHIQNNLDLHACIDFRLMLKLLHHMKNTI